MTGALEHILAKAVLKLSTLMVVASHMTMFNQLKCLFLAKAMQKLRALIGCCKSHDYV